MKISFDTVLKRIYNETGLSNQSDLADALGINRSAITQARKKGALPDKWLLALFRKFGLNPDWVETGKGNPLTGPAAEPVFANIPKVRARLCAGDGSFEVGSEIEGYYAFRNEWLRQKGHTGKMVLMDTFGNSMEPEIKDGDTILIDTSQKDILAGAIYAVGVDDTIMVKRIEKHPQKMVLLSDNKDYAPIYLKKGQMDSIRIIGKVIWICRELR